MAEPRKEFVQVGDVKLATYEWGDPVGPPLVLLHGLFASARRWDEVAARWSGEFRVIAYDQRGHGESDRVLPGGFESYNVRKRADDLDGVVRAKGLDRFSVVGHSLGGRAVIAFAKIRPEIIDRAVIVDIGPEIAPAGARKLRDNFVLRPDYDPTLVELTGPKALVEIDYLWECLAELSCPTLLVGSETSNILSPEIVARMVAEAPRIEVAVVPGTGHDVPDDNPEGFDSAVLSFLRR